MNDHLKICISKGLPPVELKLEAMKTGMRTLRMAAIERAKEGLIALTEVINGTMQDPKL
jgi:type II secretory ATPase GspE/PulE/Tfp pilus assembly ATPase PilB-like protein